MNPTKTLCKQCKECHEHTYKRTIKKRKTPGYDTFEFIYCQENKEITDQCDWGPSAPRNKDGKTYVRSTKYREKDKREFQNFIRKNPENVICYINKNPRDNRLKNMREISKQCNNQTIRGKDSSFPGITKNSFYKLYNKHKYKRTTKPKPWTARTKINGKTIHIGSYPTELEAANAYYQKMEELGREINKETAAYKRYEKWLENNP